MTVRVNQISHCHSMVDISPGCVMLLAVGEKRIVDFWRRQLLVLLTLAVQETIELCQTAERQRMWDRGFGIFGQFLCLVACVVTVARDQKSRDKGSKNKGHQNTSYQKGVMDTVIGPLQLWRSSHTFKTIKKRVFKLKHFVIVLEQKEKHIFKS